MANEYNQNEEQSMHREEPIQRYPSTNSSSRHSTPNSSGNERQFHFNINERGSGNTPRTNSLIDSTDGFTNFNEVIQHLRTTWNNHQNTSEGSRRHAGHLNSNTSLMDSNEISSNQHSKGHSSHSQHHYSSQQPYLNNYSNPRRSGPGHFNRGYASGNSEGHWNSKGNRIGSHRSSNNQPSPPIQRRPNDDQQNSYKTKRSNDSSNVNSTQSYSSQSNAYNR